MRTAAVKAVPPVQSRWPHFLMASLVVGAALFKAGAPIMPILFAIAVVGVWNFRRK